MNRKPFILRARAARDVKAAIDYYVGERNEIALLSPYSFF
jgi:hypothetical protein